MIYVWEWNDIELSSPKHSLLMKDNKQPNLYDKNESSLKDNELNNE